MKERPILFSAPMVRAILDGRKTQTRRICKPRFDDKTPCEHYKPADGDHMCRHCEHGSEGLPCPYGIPGDRLWVRETWCAWDSSMENVARDEVAGDAETLVLNGVTKWHITYKADPNRHAERWRPSIHMPRWASRITLEIEAVRVERLQEITRGDAMQEGCDFPNMQKGPDPRIWFGDLWQSINGPGSWDANPWVWVIQFSSLKP